MTATERFLKYVSYSTASDYDSDTSPSTQRQKELGYALMAEMTGQPLEKLAQDVERDYFMSAQEALEYGIIDEIYQPRK